MKIFENRRRQAFVFIGTFCILAILLLGVFLDTYSDNNTKRIIKYNSEITSEEKELGDITILIEPRGGSTDTWTKRVLEDVDGNSDGSLYAGVIYEVTLVNNTDVEIRDWTLRINVPTPVYINNAWCGQLEFHQDTQGSEKVQKMDLRKWQEVETFDIDYFVAGSDFMVPMYDGDYFIYHPSTEVHEDYITPSATDLDLYQNLAVDFIAYSHTVNDNIVPLNFTDIELTYYMYTDMMDMPMYWVVMALFAMWDVALIVTVAIDFKIRKLINQSEHDKVIIEQSMNAFMGFIDAKDPSTNGHSLRVAKYSKELARRMGLPQIECDRIYYIGLMHDCGKIGIPDSILKKPAKLTPEEYEIIKTHTTLGGKILSDFSSIPGIKEGALYHHERFDGKGYPYGLKGEEIPLIARIICVTDSFDVMNSKRYYKEKYTKEEILSEISKNRGTQFDPQIVDMFMGMIEDETVKFD